MDMPTEDTPARAYLPRSAYTIARVAANPKTAGLESGLRTAHGNLKNALRQFEDLEEQEEEKSALFDFADEVCDVDVEGFELHLLAAVNKNRDHVKYARYFKNGLRSVTQAEARDEEPALVETIVHNLANDSQDAEIGAVATQWQSKLVASRDHVVSAEKNLGLAEDASEQAKQTTIPALMAAWREEYKKMEGTLINAYPNDPKRVTRFFKPFRKTRKRAKSQSNTPPTTP